MPPNPFARLFSTQTTRLAPAIHSPKACKGKGRNEAMVIEPRLEPASRSASTTSLIVPLIEPLIEPLIVPLIVPLIGPSGTTTVSAPSVRPGRTRPPAVRPNTASNPAASCAITASASICF